MSWLRQAFMSTRDFPLPKAGEKLPFGKAFPIGGLGKFPKHREGKLGIFWETLVKDWEGFFGQGIDFN